VKSKVVIDVPILPQRETVILDAMTLDHRRPREHATDAPRIIRLTESDWRTFAQLRLRALADTLGAGDPQYREETSFTAAQWRRRLRAHAQFAVTIDDRGVGLIGAQRENAATVYLYSLWLDPSARRRGLGRALVSTAVEWARAEQARAVTLRVNTDNAAARGVYEGLGFRVAVAGSPSASTARKDELVMSLAVG
jgi:ribosomal protein S18 acetylase RimI-like enzyme